MLQQNEQDKVNFDEESFEQEQNTDICVLCKITPIDKTESNYSQLCSSCREKYIKYPIPKGVFAFLAVVLVLVIFGSLNYFSVLKDYKNLKEAEKFFESRNYLQASKIFSNLKVNYQNSEKINEKLFISSVKSGNNQLAINTYNDSFADKKVPQDVYNSIDRYYKFIDVFFETENKLIEITKDLKEEEIDNKIEELFNSDKSNYIVEYYLALRKYIAKKYDKSAELLESSYSKNNDFVLAIDSLSKTYRRLKMYDKAIECSEKALNYNKDDVFALDSLSVIDMLKNNNSEALIKATMAYDLDKYQPYVSETYAVALYVNSKKEDAIKVINELKNRENYIEDKDFIDFIDGKITLEKLYLN